MGASIIIVRHGTRGPMRVAVIRRERRRLASAARNMRAAGWPLHAIARALVVTPHRAARLATSAADIWGGLLAQVELV